MNVTIEPFYYVVWVAAFLTAIVSATIGMLGGTLLISVLAQYLKMEVLIPLHGLVQLSSNASRAWFLRPYINWVISFENAIGVVLGSILGATFVVRFPDHYYNLALGFFILIITFMPKFKVPLHFRGKWFLVGAIASFLGLFFGAVGVFVGSVFLAERMEKRTMISTQAVCQSVVHIAKVLVFMTLGFKLAPWWLLLVGTLLLTSLGSWVGTRILEKIPEKTFRIILTVIITILAFRLIFTGLAKIKQS